VTASPGKLLAPKQHIPGSPADYIFVDSESDALESKGERKENVCPIPDTLPIQLRCPPGKGFERLSDYAMMAPLVQRSCKATLGTSIGLAASGAGFVNAVIAINNVSSISEFASYANLYREFFVTHVTVHYEPQNVYGTWPAVAQAATGQPLGVLSIYHGVAAPSSLVAAANSSTIRYHHSNSKWSYTWKNTESPKGGTVISPVATTATATQGWCLSDSTSASGYSGQIQFISPVTLGCGALQQLGTFLVQFHVLFRNRL
jgi:hypothetical protein